MVLKNSKWDRKAKYQYMKKHGLNSKPVAEKPGKKWTKTDDIDALETDEEWDSETDNDLLNHFYPSMGDDELTRDQKVKIKSQILAELRQKIEDGEDISEEEIEEVDGIYLGSSEDKSKDDTYGREEDPSKFSLLKYLDNLDNNPNNRRLLKNKMTNNFLEEYGLDSYKDITKTDVDYKVKPEKKTLNDLPISELNGYKLGEDVEVPIDNVRTLTEEELQQDESRLELNKQNQFLNQIKNKYGKKTPSKVLNTNNTLQKDTNQPIDDDLDVLLGLDKDKATAPLTPSALDDVDDLINSLSIKSQPPREQRELHKPSTHAKTIVKPQTSPDEDFLDSIL